MINFDGLDFSERHSEEVILLTLCRFILAAKKMY